MTARSYRDVVLADAPQGYWRLGERGVKMRDSSAHARDASVVGAITQGTPGALPNDSDLAAYFPGSSTTSNIVDTGYVSSVGTTGDLAWEAWIKVPAAPGAGSYWVWMGQFVGGGNADIALFMDSTGKPSWKLTNNASYITGPVSIADNRWHHTVGVRQNGVISLFIDGLSVGTPVANSGPTGGAQSIWIGGYGPTAGLAYAGWLDEAAVYDHALTAAQVANHYAARTAGFSRSLRAWLVSAGPTIYTRSITETVTAATDTISRQFIGARALTETVSVTDSVARQWIGARSLSESTSVSDSIARQFIGARSLSESVPATTDAVARTTVVSRSIAETLTAATDTVARAATFARSVAESIPAASDAVARQFIGSRSVSESTTSSDTVARILSVTRAISETIPAASDSVGRVLSHIVPMIGTLISRSLTAVLKSRTATGTLISRSLKATLRSRH